MQELVEADVGIAVLPDYPVGTLLAEGRLCEVYARPSRRVRNVIALAWRSSIPLRGRHAVVRDALIGDTLDHPG